MRKIVIDKRKSVVLVMTCIIFMMTYSSLVGTPTFSRKLSIFVDENNLSHEDIYDLIVKINQFKSRDNKQLAQELKKIGKRKEKEKQNNDLFLSLEKNQDIIFSRDGNWKKIDKISKNNQNTYVFFMKRNENNLRIRE